MIFLEGECVCLCENKRKIVQCCFQGQNTIVFYSIKLMTKVELIDFKIYEKLDSRSSCVGETVRH